MSNRFVKLRYGLVDHLLDGRMSGDEYGAFSLIVLLADFRSGVWQGSGVALSAYLRSWSIRKCQRILKSLESKNYLTSRPIRGKKGNYPVVIHNYHGKVTTPATPLLESDDTSDATLPKVTTPAPTKEEVTKIKPKISAAQPRRVTRPPRSEQEQRQIVEARDRRLEKEADARREVRVGAGPGTAIWEEARKKLSQRRF